MIGKTVSHYKILEKIGEGGMGVVYKAEDTKLKRPVALKFLPLELTRDPETKSRFILEAQAASALDHNNVCTIYEIDETKPAPGEPGDGQTFIAMAFYEGEILKDKIQKGPLKIEEALNIAIQIAQGLEKAHKKGIIHRDIKPANIYITGEGVVKILDFGLAKLAGPTQLTKTGTTLGTVAYMSPEQAKGEQVDHRTDIWSLGVILYEMLTGRLPFKGDYDQVVLYSIVNEKPASLRSYRKDVPVEIEQVVLHALEKLRDNRYADLSEWIHELQFYLPEKKNSVPQKIETGLLFRKIRKPTFFIPAVCLLCLFCFWIIWSARHRSRIRWAQNVAIPEIERLVEGGLVNVVPVFELAKEALKVLPDNPKLKNWLSRATRVLSIVTEPPGAKVYKKPYMNPDDDWEFIGTTPIQNMKIPLSIYRLKIEKPNFETIIMLDYFYTGFNRKTGEFNAKRIEKKLDPAGTLPQGMVRIIGSGDLLDYFMDKYEVTNRQFKTFVDAAGYENETYWKEPFMRDGRMLTWKQAMAYFKDATGRPGPAPWLGGDYPEGQDNYPVSGVSWYEAAAYAEFAGKSLPTVVHWGNTLEVALLGLYHNLISMSNFNQRGPVPVGQYQGITAQGLYDMAGNVREWCWNESRLGRCVRGGAWNDVHYMYSSISQADPFDRSLKNGFRCVIYPDADKLPQSLFQQYKHKILRDYSKEDPVTEYIFQIYKDQFDYDKTDLEAMVVSSDTSEDWIKQKIDFAAAYENERISMYLFLPKNTEPPYQTVVYFPGSSSHTLQSSANIDNFYEVINNCSFFLKNGRAVCYPIYAGTFERRDVDAPSYRMPNETFQHKEYMIKLVKDCSRSIDYLQTLVDIDIDKLAYLGFSWGGWMGNIILAVEDRFKAAILVVGGLRENKRSRPEVDPINFITRIKVPTLMLNGKYDYNFPYDLSVAPMYRLMGTPEKDKKLVLYETDHFIPRTGLIKESLDWLDSYLGPVR